MSNWNNFTLDDGTDNEYAVENLLDNPSALFDELSILLEMGEVEVRACKFCGNAFATTYSVICYSAECTEKQETEERTRVEAELDKRVKQLENHRVYHEIPVFVSETKPQKQEEPKPIFVPEAKKILPVAEKVVERTEYLGQAGYVYLVKSENGICKIGISAKPKQRFIGLQAQSPQKLELLHTFFVDDYRGVERQLHSLFRSQKSHYEWFNLTKEQIEWFCNLSDTSIIPAIWV